MEPELSIGEVARRTGVAATTLRYYEQIGLLPFARRAGGQRRYHESVLSRLEVIRLCKAAGFALDEIGLLFADDAPGRPVSRALAEDKLARIDTQIDALQRAREIIEWGMRCTCPSIDDCACGVHVSAPAEQDRMAR
ncbi:MerR family transcriptional regulator [Mycobacterium sp. PS03-16]|uniref:MerR family transcriptional regulator n=1 Tax=Mycobacterium sp. PS03-16 TaxID=2559611 RepID=UPI001FD76A81|nr:MerR family transcriptional regulator [Mycobacterium sp. PS03-16]